MAKKVCKESQINKVGEMTDMCYNIWTAFGHNTQFGHAERQKTDQKEGTA
jgi:hypothetical protein